MQPPAPDALAALVLAGIAVHALARSRRNEQPAADDARVVTPPASMPEPLGPSDERAPASSLEELARTDPLEAWRLDGHR